MVFFEILFKKWGIKINDVMDFGFIFGEFGFVYILVEWGICELFIFINFYFKYYFFGELDILDENLLVVDYDFNIVWYLIYIWELCFIKV